MKKSLILLLFALLTTAVAHAQGPPCPSPPCLPTGPGLPKDNGLSFLLIAGIAYGYKKLRKK